MGYEDQTYETVLVRKTDGILKITLNKPESLNALMLNMLEDLVVIIRQGTVDPSVRVILIIGSGKGFSAGGNIKAMADPEVGGNAHPLKRPLFNVGVMGPGERLDREVVTGLKLMKSLWECWKPTIAAINGLATGAGMDMALVCDIRLASEKAQMSQAYTNIGLMPFDGGMYHLPRMVGLGKAYEYMYTGRFISAQEALSVGLVNKVFKEDELEIEAMKMATEIAARPPVALQTLKYVTQKALEMKFTDAMDYFYQFYDILLKTDDHVEGVNSIIEKRAAVFKGR